MKLIFFLSLFLIITNSYAENRKLQCKGKEEFTYTEDWRSSSHERNFVVEFNEKKNLVVWNTYDFSMCYMNPSNENKIIKSDAQFSNESIYYLCETHGINNNADYEYFNRTSGELIIDRFTGEMKILEKSYVRKSNKEEEKMVLFRKGNYSCDPVVNKKF